MNDDVKRKLLCFYLVFQCIANVLNIVILFSVMSLFTCICLGTDGSVVKDIRAVTLTWLTCFFIICLCIFYVFISFKAAISTAKIIKKIPLTKFEKFSSFVFALTMPFFYLLMAIFSFIPKILLLGLELLPDTLPALFNTVLGMLSVAFLGY